MTNPFRAATVLAVLTLCLPACSNSPEALIAEADKAVEAAREAEAPDYDLPNYVEAMSGLMEARQLARDGKNRKAREAARRAKSSGEKALASAQAKKPEAKANYPKELKAARAALAEFKAYAGKSTKADSDAKQTIEWAEQQITEAETSAKGGRYGRALFSVRMVKNRLDVLAAVRNAGTTPPPSVPPKKER